MTESDAQHAGTPFGMTTDGQQEHTEPTNVPESLYAVDPQDADNPAEPVEPAASVSVPTRRWGWYEFAFAAVVLAALGLRLFELSARTMHYD